MGRVPTRLESVESTDGGLWTGCDRVHMNSIQLGQHWRRHLLSIALASLVGAALAVPAAQAASRSYDFQGGSWGQVRIQLSVTYKNKQRNGAFTPRSVIYDSSVPVSCNPPVSGTFEAPSGSYILGTPDYTLIKLSKGSFTYWYSYQLPTTPPGGTASAAATGKVIKTKRVEGTVSIFNYNSPPSWNNCTSGAPLPYSATQCRRPYNRPPYIEKSLPVCWADV